MTLAGKVALITGGKRIGQTVAGELARRGADVALTYRGSRAEADQAAAEVRAAGRRAFTIQADLANPPEGERAVATAADTLGRLDVLVNMASTYRSVAFDEMTLAVWRGDLDVNLTAAYVCAAAAVPYMRRAGEGRIVNFADWVARSGRPRYKGFLAYYVAKAGVIALTEGLALELAADRILVNAVAPGPILPPPDMPEDERRAVERATPVGRWGGPLEIAKAVMALVESDFITGETIRVDGGRHVN